MRLSGSELVSISLLFLLISVAAAQYQYYDDEDQVGHGGSRGTYSGNLWATGKNMWEIYLAI